jgi:tol-pal system protein YbgF
MFARFVIISIVALLLPVSSMAQDAATLADIRQQLTVLYGDVQRLRTELSTTGGLSTGTAGNTPLERLNSIETQLQRLTAKTEELEFRVNRVVKDGTNRVGDLEFRLCELESTCDISQLGDTPSLGGDDHLAATPVTDPAPADTGPALAVGEQGDVARAQAALTAGDFQTAADILAGFQATYPGSPLAQEAAILRGDALAGLGAQADAARAYLSAFSDNPQGLTAPEALFKLGRALGGIGQTQDACVTLAEVGIRFPGNPTVLEAQSAMRNLGCS